MEGCISNLTRECSTMWFSQWSLTVCVLEPSNHTATEMRASPSVSVYKRSGKTLWIFSLLHFWFICRFFLTSHADVSKQRQNAQEETEGCLSQGQLKCGQVAILNIISKPSKNNSILERKEEKIWGSVQCCITFARHSTHSLLSFSLTHHIALFKTVPESGSLEWKWVSWMSSSSCCNKYPPHPLSALNCSCTWQLSVPSLLVGEVTTAFHP